jgi:hypothetical protein
MWGTEIRLEFPEGEPIMGTTELRVRIYRTRCNINPQGGLYYYGSKSH